jgi:hypothetical protein
VVREPVKFESSIKADYLKGCPRIRFIFTGFFILGPISGDLLSFRFVVELENR